MKNEKFVDFTGYVLGFPLSLSFVDVMGYLPLVITTTAATVSALSKLTDMIRNFKDSKKVSEIKITEEELEDFKKWKEYRKQYKKLE